jgi:vacuolar-type H+-ATPase subunit I/STV1
VHTSWEAGLLGIAFAIILVLGLIACVSFAFLLSRPALAGTLSILPSNPWWLIYRDSAPPDAAQPLRVIAALVMVTVIGFIFSLRAHRLYRNSRTPVLPYLLLFFLTLGIECLRGATAVLFATDTAMPTAIMLTRAVYWGRFAGLFALLLFSLICVELKYRHVYVLGGGSLLVAFAIAASIPVDRTTFLSQFMWKLADEQGVWFVNLVIAALVVVTTIGAAVLKQDRRFLVLAGGLALLLGARELLFFMVQPIPLACGIAVLAAGAVACLRTIAGIYRET